MSCDTVSSVDPPIPYKSDVVLQFTQENNVKIITLLVLALLSGCAATGDTKSNQTAWIIAGAVVVGAVIVSSSGGSSSTKPKCSIVVSGSGSDQVCR